MRPRTAYCQHRPRASRRYAAVSGALTDGVTRYPRRGFWKVFDRLRAEGWAWNHKRVHRALRLNPDQNAYIERFDRATDRGAERALLESIAELRVLTDAWLRVYNGERPHDSLG